MWFIIKVCSIVLLALFLRINCQNKDDDESRPYEFGFVIDGEQHRHEKKDVNGIIQGEFGFITADGVYHVTVYATDENGNFRILSMKNIRLSDQPNLDFQRKGLKQQPGSPSPPKIQKSQALQVAASTERNGRLQFTTQPTVKPACGGCGYITTQKPLPGQKFPTLPPLQPLRKPQPAVTPPNAIIPPDVVPPPDVEIISHQAPGVLQEQSQRYQEPGSNINQESPQPPQNILPPVRPQNIPAPVGPQTVAQQETFDQTPQLPAAPNVQPDYPQIDTRFQDINGPDKQYELVNGVQPNQPPQESEKITALRKEVNNNIASIEEMVHNLPYQRPNGNGGGTRLSGIAVSDGAIHVPGNPDIPIRDKYPGMQEGLPAGIQEGDIMNILYKFNYTVGFHGHYEKGYANGAKEGGYFVNGRDGVSRIVTYVADENGYRPKVKFVRLGLDSDQTPKEETEKTFGLVNFEFVWYPVS